MEEKELRRFIVHIIENGTHTKSFNNEDIYSLKYDDQITIHIRVEHK